MFTIGPAFWGSYGGGNPNVILYLQGEGANGGSVITDSSIYNRSVLFNSGVTTSNTQVKHGSTSLFVNTTHVSYLNTGGIFDFGTGDFTLEGWLYPLNVDSTRRSFVSYDNGGSFSTMVWSVDFTSTDFRFFCGIGSTGALLLGGSLLTANTWQHVAAVRDAGAFRLYLNGLQIAFQAASGALNVVAQYPCIGQRSGGGQNFNGYMDDVRISTVCWYPNGNTFFPT